MKTRSLLARMGLLFSLGALFPVAGQVTLSASSAQQITATSAATSSSITPTIQAFQAEQRTLISQELALEANGATPAQVAAWRQQNAAALALQDQRARAIAVAAALKLLPENHQPRIPANASPTMTAFLNAQATLANAQAHLHNQLVLAATAGGATLSFAQMEKLRFQEVKLFQTQNATLLATQAQRTQTIAASFAQQPQSVPPLVIPPNATSQMTAYLTTRHQIMQALVQLHNQYATATPAERDAALRAWFRQNQSLLASVQQQARSVSPAADSNSN